MNYNLSTSLDSSKKRSTIVALRDLFSLVSEEQRTMVIAFAAIFINAGLSLVAPYLVGHTIDVYVQNKDYHGVLVMAGVLLSIFACAFVAHYTQMRLMGGVGQRMLFSLRNAVYKKLLELPVDFFNQNKSGDLISRINNDSDKINQFFSQSLVQFVSNIFTMIGAGIFLISIDVWLGLAALAPAGLIWLFTRVVSPWVKKKNADNMQSTGGMSAEIQESLTNFKVIVAFNRRDYFRQRFDEANRQNYETAVKAGLANNIFMPVYSMMGNIGQIIVLVLGIVMISKGMFTIGLLISFVVYVQHFYNPLRHLAGLWASFQVAMAGWERISNLLSLESNMKQYEPISDHVHSGFVTFHEVSFMYPNGKDVLHNVSFSLDRGKTYAFVGPTGGGKTSTSFLLARLYDCSKWQFFLDGRDIRSYTSVERTRKVGFILQDPFIFGGTVRDNILYGNDELQVLKNNELLAYMQKFGLDALLERFDSGLDTTVSGIGETLSLGQKQIIAFIRAVLREPDLLILDEATANIDTVTEQILEVIIKKLPVSTTKVIIAHRLNTIESADQIFFVNSRKVVNAGSFDHAVQLLLHGKREG